MLGIIGGSGLYALESLSDIEEVSVTTPFGDPSDVLIKATYHDKPVVFLSRHGKGHRLLPHEVNYQANIWALKSLGVTFVISVSAVGSLRQELEPGHFVCISQYVDRVRDYRKKTFFGNGLVAHVSTARPVCDYLTKLCVESVPQSMVLHQNKTYVCVDGPRFGTQAESFIMQKDGCDVVGMTNVPEVFLAKEAQMGYLTLAIVTDYDAWQTDPAMHATVEAIMQRFGKSLEQAKNIVGTMIKNFEPTEEANGVRQILSQSVLTPKEHWTAEHVTLMEVLSL